jgi:hypothetical protein
VHARVLKVQPTHALDERARIFLFKWKPMKPQPAAAEVRAPAVRAEPAQMNDF